MRTPAAYNNNLKNHIITMQMLVDCLYSSNKRAKNWRDKQREYRERRSYYYDKYDNEGKAKEKKEEYYHQKEIMLSALKPVCIHKECYGYERTRIYDYESDYIKYYDEFVWKNSFYDKVEDAYVCFGDIEDKSKPLYHYYLLLSNHCI